MGPCQKLCTLICVLFVRQISWGHKVAFGPIRARALKGPGGPLKGPGPRPFRGPRLINISVLPINEMLPYIYMYLYVSYS